MPDRQRLRPTDRRTASAVGAMGAVGAVAALVGLTGCGGGDRAALAIEDLRWNGTTTLVVTTECATEVEAEVGPDHSGTGLPEVTLWGNPSVGTCRPSVSVEIPEGTARIVDGTTSMVVDLPVQR